MRVQGCVERFVTVGVMQLIVCEDGLDLVGGGVCGCGYGHFDDGVVVLSSTMRMLTGMRSWINGVGTIRRASPHCTQSQAQIAAGIRGQARMEMRGWGALSSIS